MYCPSPSSLRFFSSRKKEPSTLLLGGFVFCLPSVLLLSARNFQKDLGAGMNFLQGLMSKQLCTPMVSPHSEFIYMKIFLSSYTFCGVAVFLPPPEEKWYSSHLSLAAHILRIQASCLPSKLGSVMGSRKVMILYIIWLFLCD